MHAGELEASILLHADPSLVADSRIERDRLADPRPYLLLSDMRSYARAGVIGKPSQASAAKGKALLGSIAESFEPHYRLLQ
jgi:creatinine amidohydrolase